ncbi:hypothetical protein L1987_28776 [Smallanthus sonchifolius]|uniref:Uncharacterized protein n=1 Tax=Smallanthus sonchifolius TaxID=185202 RepID=A0ACB9I0U8_9ASTR|nr:hypothetical protein L1987_28776 [Smallanthus sonchifolius]
MGIFLKTLLIEFKVKMPSFVFLPLLALDIASHWLQLYRSSEYSRIIFLKDVDLSRRDYSIKVRVLRLWKQPMYNNHAETYSIEMIVVDEEGTTMQANVLKRWFPLFEQLLKETGCYFIVKPTTGRNNSRNKYVANDNKIGIYSDSKVYLCSDFSGPTYGFSFTTFDPIVAQYIPEDTPLDVIGFVADVGEVKNIKTSKGKDTYKVNVLIQDLKMQKVFLSLWGSYADEILDIWANKEKSGLIVVILQFGTLKYYQHSAYVNNAFNVSKLFINSEIDEITSFKNSLLQNSGLSTCSVDSSKVSGTFMSLFDEYVVNTEFNNTAEVNLSKVKQVVIVATVELIPPEIPWYYQSCKTSNRKLTKINDGGDIFDTKLVDQHVLYECKTVGCNPTAVPGSQRLKISLTVQDSTGTLSFTLFDREATKLLKKNASLLIEKHLSGGDTGLYPDEFPELLGKKFAFKIKANSYEPGNSESIANTLSEIPSQETLNFKASLESIDDNVTPLSQTEQGNGKRHVGKETTFKRKFKNSDFKRKLVDAYDIEDTGALSATKAISDATNLTYYRTCAKMMRKKRKQYLDARKVILLVVSNIKGLNNIHNNLPSSPNYGTAGNVMEIHNDNQSISYQHTNVTFSDVHIRSPLSDITNDSKGKRNKRREYMDNKKYNANFKGQQAFKKPTISQDNPRCVYENTENMNPTFTYNRSTSSCEDCNINVITPLSQITNVSRNNDGYTNPKMMRVIRKQHMDNKKNNNNSTPTKYHSSTNKKYIKLSNASTAAPTYNNNVEASSSNNSNIQSLQFTKVDHQHDGEIITYNSTGKSKA